MYVREAGGDCMLGRQEVGVYMLGRQELEVAVC